MSQVSRAVVDAGDDVELTCTVEFGSPINTSMWMTRQQFPRLTMAFDNVQLTPDTHEYTAGHPGDTPHTLTTVSATDSLSLSVSLSVSLSICLSVCLSVTPDSSVIFVLVFVLVLPVIF